MLLLLALLITAAPGAGPQPTLTATVKDASRIILGAGKPHVIDVSEHGGEGLQSAKLLQVVRGPDTLFVVLDLVNGSNMANPGGHCGAGNESYIVWLALTPAFKVKDGQHVAYESCLDPESAHDAEKCGDSIAAGKACVFVHHERKTSVRFDPAHPEAGLAVTPPLDVRQ